jgi:moderate conductance mechanosensitive channel
MSRPLLMLALLQSLFLATLVVAQTEGDPAKTAPPSDAERIAQLGRAIADGDTQIAEITARLDDPNSEYALAEKAFATIDAELAEAKKAGDGKITGEALAELEKKRQLARERFDLAIAERKAMQQQLVTSKKKKATDQAMLDRLTAPPVEEVAEEKAGSPDPAKKSDGVADEKKPEASPDKKATSEEGSDAQTKTEAPEEEASEELVDARRAATTKKQEAKLAVQDARSLSDRLKQTEDDIALERKLLSTAQKKESNAGQSRDSLNADLQKRMGAGETWSELAALREEVADASKRLRDAREQIQRHRDRIDLLQSERNELQSQQLAAARNVEEKQAEASEAEKQVQRLQNPLSPENILKWTVLHGPKVLFVIVGMLLILTGARVFERRFVVWLSMTARGGNPQDRENRARTLVSVFHNAVRVVVIGGGVLMIANEFGINIVPLLGGAAVLGLAAAFGAQNLIRDYFYGFIMILENQYTVNDVIEISGTSGVVERITLRITVLRDLQGIVHFVPHGTIDKVSNMTHGWSRALFSIGVSYNEDVDRVMEVLLELGRELRKDPKFASMILDEPEMLGVDGFGESEVVIKFFIKTRTLKQWAVKRELQRRIKYKFDELGIEIPYPHRTIYHHYAGTASPPSESAPGGPFPGS